MIERSAKIFGMFIFVGDCLIHPDNLNGRAFTTYDRDNDASNSNCAVGWHGAWWYNSCGGSNLNGRYYGDARIGTVGIAWYNWKNSWYSMKRASMKIRPNN